MSSTERIRLARGLQSVAIAFDGPAARRGGEGVEELLRSEYQRGYDAGADHVNRQILEQRDEINAKVMADPRLKGTMDAPPFDAKRMIYGGFKPIVEL